MPLSQLGYLQKTSFSNKVTFIGTRSQDLSIFFGDTIRPTTSWENFSPPYLVSLTSPEKAFGPSKQRARDRLGQGGGEADGALGPGHWCLLGFGQTVLPGLLWSFVPPVPHGLAF